MAKFPFSFHVFVYESGVDRLERAFESSIRQIEAEQKDAYASYMAYIDSGQDDTEYEWDGDHRYPVRSTSFELEQEASDIGVSAQVIRDAFITAAYHYWEKFAIGWTGKRGFITLVENTPYPVHQRLSALSNLNNHLKHGSDARRIMPLCDEWPEIFSVSPRSIIQNRKSHWIVNVRNDHVREAFQIIRGSGPVETTGEEPS